MGVRHDKPKNRDEGLRDKTGGIVSYGSYHAFRFV